MSIREEQIQVSGLSVDVVKKDIKNMHLTVYPPNGRIRVSAPIDLSDEAIRLFVVGKIHWIKKRQKSFQEQIRELPRVYIAGESHYFDGKRYLLRVNETQQKQEVRIKNKKYLDLYIKKNADIKTKQKILNDFYRTHLKVILPEIILKWEEKIGVQCQDWEVKKMRTKWGSCNKETGKIIFNLELAKKPRHCVEYIVVHELLHLLVRYHNNEFRSLLYKFMPNWQVYQRELNELPIA